MTTFIWSIDDAGTGNDKMVESMTKICRHFDSHGVKSTWFVVPKRRLQHGFTYTTANRVAYINPAAG